MDNSDYKIFTREEINSLKYTDIWRNCITIDDKPDRRYKDKKVNEFKNYATGYCDLDGRKYIALPADLKITKEVKEKYNIL